MIFLSTPLDKHDNLCVSLPGLNDINDIMKKKIKKYDIKGLRKKLKWSQEEAATKFGVSIRTWQRIESDGGSLADFIKFVESIGLFVTQSPIEVFKVGDEVFNSKNFEI